MIVKQKTYDEYEDNYKKIKSEVNVLLINNEAKEKEAEKLTTELHDLDSKSKQLYDELEKLKNEITVKSQCCDNSKQKQYELVEELSVITIKVSELEKTVKEKQDEVVLKQESIAKLQDEITKIELDINEIRSKQGMMNIQLGDLVGQKESNSVVNNLCQLINQSQTVEFKALFDNMIIENTELGLKYLTYVIKPIFTLLINFKENRVCKAIYKHVVISDIFLSSFVLVNEGDNFEILENILKSMEQLFKKLNNWDQDIGFITDFYMSFLKKISHEKISYFVLGSIVKQHEAFIYNQSLNDSILEEFFKSFILPLSCELKQQYFDECFKNLYLNYTNEKNDLFFYKRGYQINFLLCLFNDYSTMFSKKNDQRYFCPSKDQFQQMLFFPKLFQGVVNYIEQNLPDCLSEYFEALRYDEKNLDKDTLNFIKKHVALDKKQATNNRNNIKIIGENNASLDFQNQQVQINKSSEIVKRNKKNDNRDSITIEITKIKDIELLSQNNLQNNRPMSVKNNVEQIKKDSNILQDNNNDVKDVVIQNYQLNPYYSEQAKNLCDLIIQDKTVQFKQSFDTVTVENNNQYGYLVDFIQPILGSIGGCKYPGKYLEYVLKSDSFLDMLVVACETSEDGGVNRVFSDLQLIFQKDFLNKQIIINKFYESFFKKVKPDNPLSYIVLKNVFSNVSDKDVRYILNSFICSMTKERKQLYFDECLQNVYNYRFDQNQQLFFEKSEHQILFLQCLCGDYGSKYTKATEEKLDVGSNLLQASANNWREFRFVVELQQEPRNPYSLQFTKNHVQQAFEFPTLFNVMFDYIESSDPTVIYEFISDLSLNESTETIIKEKIENYLFQKQIIEKKASKDIVSVLREKIKFGFSFKDSFIFSMGERQFLQFFQYEMNHIFLDYPLHLPYNDKFLVFADNNVIDRCLNSLNSKYIVKNEKFLTNLQKKIKFIQKNDPFGFFIFSLKTDFCNSFCQRDFCNKNSCGLKKSLKQLFSDKEITNSFQSLIALYELQITFPVYKKDKNGRIFLLKNALNKLSNMDELHSAVKKVQIIDELSEIDSAFKARFYQLCCNWLCENQSSTHRQFIKSLNKVWQIAKKSSNKADQKSRCGELLELQNYAKDRYYRSIFDSEGLKSEKQTYQTREERIRVIQKNNLDPVCSVDEVVTYIHGFSKNSLNTQLLQ